MKGKIIRPGAVWTDTDGKPIQAHGGCILHDKGTYYWYGENKDGKTTNGRVDVIGISCYSSQDLLNWKNEGIVLPAVPDDANHDLHTGNVLERPKVIYNGNTGKYVMWAHVDSRDYKYARTGAAVSGGPTGPFSYMGSFRPNGAESRDMTLFQDDDGSAYLIHSSEGNATLHIARLADDYLSVEGPSSRQFIGCYREAPALFKHEGAYYMITSACTGWQPNAAGCATAESPMGEWEDLGNPCLGTEEEVRTTFRSQSAYILPWPGRPGRFIYMGDRWNSKDLGDSRHIWLPLDISNGRATMRWFDKWDLDYTLSINRL